MKTNKILKIGLSVLGLIAIAAVTFILNDYLRRLPCLLRGVACIRRSGRDARTGNADRTGS